MKSHVYRNLNTGLWSIRQQRGCKWVVVGHARSCVLKGVTVRQSENARQRAIKDGRRNVHCWAIGQLIACSADAVFKDRQPQVGAGIVPNVDMSEYRTVTYYPFTDRTLIYEDDGSEYAGSDYALFTLEQKMVVI